MNVIGYVNVFLSGLWARARPRGPGPLLPLTLSICLHGLVLAGLLWLFGQRDAGHLENPARKLSRPLAIDLVYVERPRAALQSALIPPLTPPLTPQSVAQSIPDLVPEPVQKSIKAWRPFSPQKRGPLYAITCRNLKDARLGPVRDCDRNPDFTRPAGKAVSVSMARALESKALKNGWATASANVMPNRGAPDMSAIEQGLARAAPGRDVYGPWAWEEKGAR